MMYIAATDKLEILRALTGILHPDVSLEEAREERLREYESNGRGENPQP